MCNNKLCHALTVVSCLPPRPPPDTNTPSGQNPTSQTQRRITQISILCTRVRVCASEEGEEFFWQSPRPQHRSDPFNSAELFQRNNGASLHTQTHPHARLHAHRHNQVHDRRTQTRPHARTHAHTRTHLLSVFAVQALDHYPPRDALQSHASVSPA